MFTQRADKTLLVTIGAAAALIGQMNLRSNADPAAVAAHFQALADGVAAVPPGMLGPNFDKNILAWPQMWQSGEYVAARYQLLQLVRRLKNRSDGWASDAACGPAPSVSRNPYVANSISMNT
jgi:hypothetical protein